MALDLILIPVTAFVIGFVCSQAGVSGAFLLIPFQLSVLGFTSPSVNATNFLYNIIAIPSGVYRFWKERRMIWILALIIIAGYIPGIFIGSLVRVNYLIDPKAFKLFIGLVLLYIGGRLFWSAVRPEKGVRMLDERIKEFGEVRGIVRVEKISFKTVYFDFWDEKHSFPPLPAFFVSFGIGIVGGAYGVGGGALMSPLLVAFFHLPIHTIAGANLLGTFVASILGVWSFTALGYPPNLKVGLLLGIGGLSGIYAGARFQKHVQEVKIRLVLSILIILLAAKYVMQFWR